MTDLYNDSMLKNLELEELIVFRAKMSKMGKRKMIMVPMSLYPMIEKETFDESLLEITCRKVKPEEDSKKWQSAGSAI